MTLYSVIDNDRHGAIWAVTISSDKANKMVEIIHRDTDHNVYIEEFEDDPNGTIGLPWWVDYNSGKVSLERTVGDERVYTSVKDAGLKNPAGIIGAAIYAQDKASAEEKAEAMFDAYIAGFKKEIARGLK